MQWMQRRAGQEGRAGECRAAPPSYFSRRAIFSWGPTSMLPGGQGAWLEQGVFGQGAICACASVDGRWKSSASLSTELTTSCNSASVAVEDSGRYASRKCRVYFDTGCIPTHIDSALPHRLARRLAPRCNSPRLLLLWQPPHTWQHMLLSQWAV
eukprot:364428-Chlamydomonas_euryale.AAC.2